MSIKCTGRCSYPDFVIKTSHIGVKYEKGEKRCTICGYYTKYEGIRCPCCGIILRTNPRWKKRIKSNNPDKSKEKNKWCTSDKPSREVFKKFIDVAKIS